MLEIIVTKISVKKVMPKLYSVMLNLVVKDGIIEVINQNFSQNYRTGQNIENIVGRFKMALQEVIGNYKEEKQIFSASELDTAITTLKNNLVG